VKQRQFIRACIIPRHFDLLTRKGRFYYFLILLFCSLFSSSFRYHNIWFLFFSFPHI
jgi:hypothetical protein